MHHLDFEKIIDKLGSKYEAVIRMSAIARKLADDGATEESMGGKKITSVALQKYLEDHHAAAGAQPEVKK